MLNVIKEKINGKLLLNSNEIDFVIEYINTTEDLVGAVELYAALQNNPTNLVKVHKETSKKIIDIVTLDDTLSLDETFFEKWFENNIKSLSHLQYPLQTHISNTEDSKKQTKNKERYLAWLKLKPNPYIVPDYRIAFNKENNIT